MKAWIIHLALAVLICSVGCTDSDDPNPDPEPDPQLPDEIPNEWFEGLTGSIENHKVYVSGPLEGEECTETFAVDGANITDVIPEGCPSCELTYNIFLTLGDDCPGGDDIEEEGKLSFDLNQETGEATVWSLVDGWFGSDWAELGTGSLVRNDDELTFDFHFEWDDPDNGNWAGNYTADEPCSWTELCTWDGFYTTDLSLPFEWLDED